MQQQSEENVLRQNGFTEAEIVNLLRERSFWQQNSRLQQETIDDERKRQEFIKWLYLQGRLES